MLGQAVIGDKFVQKERVDESTMRLLGDLYDAEQGWYDIALLDGEVFISALRELAGAAG